MSFNVRQIPDYARLCELSKRHKTLDPEAVLACSTVHAVGHELAAALQSSLARHGLSEGRLRVLAQLMEHQRAVTHSELAEWSAVTNGTITGLVDGLEREGYVRRSPSPDDRRVMLIELTDEGLTLVRKVLPDHLKRLARMMSGLSKEEQTQLVDLLLKVHGGLPALLEP